MDPQLVTIYTECCSCGTLELLPTAFLLTIQDHGEGHYVTFFCPRCYEERRVSVKEDLIVALLRARVAAEEVHVPDEVLEHPSDDVPPLTVDDVMDFIIDMRVHDGLLTLKTPECSVNHKNDCCKVHRTHASPHRGCILR